jgi:hypothetical protein
MRVYRTRVTIPANHPMNKDEVEYKGEFFFDIKEFTKFVDLCKAEGLIDIVGIPVYVDDAERAFNRMIKNVSYFVNEV